MPRKVEGRVIKAGQDVIFRTAAPPKDGECESKMTQEMRSTSIEFFGYGRIGVCKHFVNKITHGNPNQQNRPVPQATTQAAI